MKSWIVNIIILLLAIGIIVIISIVASKNLTANESTLLSVLLCILSIVASWLVASFFAKNAQKEALEEVKSEHQSNLRTYALNAAEKVNNLSNELSRLALYLSTELERDDESDEFTINSKIERIESAIHIVNTLKSVNDTSLSDWKGVIGDELEEREEEKEEREERLLELTEKIESIVQNQNFKTSKTSNDELDFIKQQLEQLGKVIANPKFNVRASTKPPKEKVELSCPNCDNLMRYEQRKNIKGRKVIKCTSCDKRSLSRYSEDKGFYLTLEKFIPEVFNCPWCNEVNEKEISNIPFTKEVVTCGNCKNRIKATRKLDMGLSIATFGNSVKPNKGDKDIPAVKLTEELLNKIEEALPEQPWPQHIHKEVAQKLDISNKTAHRGIYELIRQGKCNPQIDGIVYVKTDLESKVEDGHN